ncbi:MAG: hypothetical protein U0T81_13520 [Saprospiraceae bacterium]
MKLYDLINPLRPLRIQGILELAVISLNRNEQSILMWSVEGGMTSKNKKLILKPHDFDHYPLSADQRFQRSSDTLLVSIRSSGSKTGGAP